MLLNHFSKLAETVQMNFEYRNLVEDAIKLAVGDAQESLEFEPGQLMS